MHEHGLNNSKLQNHIRWKAKCFYLWSQTSSLYIPNHISQLSMIMKCLRQLTYKSFFFPGSVFWSPRSGSCWQEQLLMTSICTGADLVSQYASMGHEGARRASFLSRTGAQEPNSLLTIQETVALPSSTTLGTKPLTYGIQGHLTFEVKHQLSRICPQM